VDPLTSSSLSGTASVMYCSFASRSFTGSPEWPCARWSTCCMAESIGALDSPFGAGRVAGKSAIDADVSFRPRYHTG